MQWQLTLSILAQPTFDADASREKADVFSELMSLLSGEETDFVPMDEEDTLALLRMAGRIPIRKLDGGTGTNNTP